MRLKAVPEANSVKEPLDSKNFAAGRELRAHLIECFHITNEKTEAQRSWVTCAPHGLQR